MADVRAEHRDTRPITRPPLRSISSVTVDGLYWVASCLLHHFLTVSVCFGIAPSLHGAMTGPCCLHKGNC